MNSSANLALSLASIKFRQGLDSTRTLRYKALMIFEQPNYRLYLKDTLTKRARTSKGYSLRGFAEKLNVSNSYLSEVLAGKKSFSVELAFKIAVKLALTEAEAQYFCLLVQMDQEKDPEFRGELERRLHALNPQRRSHDLTVDLFKAIADWHHFAILELTCVTGFRADAANVARALNIPKVEAELALERLLRLELLEGTPGNYRKSEAHVFAESPTPNAALRSFHRQVLEKVLTALETQGPGERLSATDLVALDSRQLPEVDRLSREFSASVLALASKARTRDHVYALSTHFTRLTKKETK